MGLFGGGLQKLELIGYSKNDFSQTSKVGSFSLPINPQSFNHSYKIGLHTKKDAGVKARLRLRSIVWVLRLWT